MYRIGFAKSIGLGYYMHDGVHMETKEYLPRIVDKKLSQYLKIFGAVCIEGPKWCGKTWTSQYHSKSKVFIGNPEGDFQNRRLAEISPDLVLEGEPPRLIDEWQEVPAIWDAVRYKVDQNALKGMYILTGSSTPNHKGILHSGAGRIGKLRMRPMSLYESKDSSGDVSLFSLCTNQLEPKYTGEVKLIDLINLLVRGGWPGAIDLSPEEGALLSKEYINAIIDDDVFRIDGVKRNLSKMRLLLRSLARNESTTASNRSLKNDIKEIDDEDVDVETIKEYLDILERLYVTDNLHPFAPNVRSSVRIKQSVKRHLADPSLACSLLGLNSSMLLNDLETFGLLFEALCERDLRIYAESFGGQLYHYQDYKDNEIDAVLEMPDGSWCAFEIKLGANQIDAAAKSLLKIKKMFEDDGKGKAPSVLCVISGLSNAAYKRPDGVYVVPITALKN